MKTWRWIYCIALLVSMLIFHAVDGYCTEKTPEQLVHDFYQWYFAENSGSDMAERRDEIHKYVARMLVDDVRKDTSGIYYFTKVGSYGAWWDGAATEVKKAVEIGGGVFMVPVEFVLERERRNVVALVKRYGGALKIFKVMDVYPFM